MEKYAIVKIGGQQHKITEGMLLDVNELPQKEGEQIEVSPVLLVREADEFKIGTPSLDIKIKATVIKHLKGEKVDVYKYKSKVRYRKHTGFRALLTRIQINQIGDKKEEKPGKTRSKKSV